MTASRSIWSKLGWFALLWANGVVATALVAYGLKFFMSH
ncbi:MAG TPA: DUF2474 family protein [Alphaproteobacteria bacterium]|nr:DUF2474 family protein [Alphaproteobacteria bacterium]